MRDRVRERRQRTAHPTPERVSREPVGWFAPSEPQWTAAEPPAQLLVEPATMAQPTGGHDLSRLSIWPASDEATTTPDSSVAVQRSPAGDPAQPAEPEPAGGATIAQRIRRAAATGGSALDHGVRADFERGLGADLSGLQLHTDAEAGRLSRSLGARAFTSGMHIFVQPDAYAPGTAEGRRLLAHEAVHTIQQAAGPVDVRPVQDGLAVSDPSDRFEQAAEQAAESIALGPPAGRLLAPAIPPPFLPAGGALPVQVQRQPTDTETETKTNIQQLDEMLDAWNTPEEEVIALLGRLSSDEKATVLSGSYKQRIARALNIREMVRAVANLNPPLEVKLEWVEAAALLSVLIDYANIRGFVTAAPQPERSALKTPRWRDYFVTACTNETIVQAVNDLGFGLATKLDWMLAEGTSFGWVADVIRNTPAAELPPVAADTALLGRLKDALGEKDFPTVERMLNSGVLGEGRVINATDTGNQYKAWVTLFRDGVTISKDVTFLQGGTFKEGGFEALKGRVIGAVTAYLSGKYRLKIESVGTGPQEGDGLYPITVQVVDSRSGEYPMYLHGGEHGRTRVNQAEGNIYELGLPDETQVPDIVLAHESAHMILGASDEYENAKVSSRVVTNDNSLMGNFYQQGMDKAEIKARHFQFLVHHVSRYFPGRTISIVK